LRRNAAVRRRWRPGFASSAEQQWWQRHGRRIAVFADTDFVAGARIAGYTGYTGCARIRAA